MTQVPHRCDWCGFPYPNIDDPDMHDDRCPVTDIVRICDICHAAELDPPEKNEKPQ